MGQLVALYIGNNNKVVSLIGIPWVGNNWRGQFFFFPHLTLGVWLPHMGVGWGGGVQFLAPSKAIELWHAGGGAHDWLSVVNTEWCNSIKDMVSHSACSVDLLVWLGWLVGSTSQPFISLPTSRHWESAQQSEQVDYFSS